jgi:hypothetical protein
MYLCQDKHCQTIIYQESREGAKNTKEEKRIFKLNLCALLQIIFFTLQMLEQKSRKKLKIFIKNIALMKISIMI